MTSAGKASYDVLVIGSGFGGTLTALGLHKIGLKVGLIEKKSHPRFAIGESSTPIADMILRDLSYKYELPWLNALSRYGSWQEKHPEIACGLKRGFSYYRHSPHKPFQTDKKHMNELLVAASSNDPQSDTNWFRADTDSFFVDQFLKTGADYFDQTNIIHVERESVNWRVNVKRTNEELRFTSRWIVDATGSGQFLNEYMGIGSNSTGFRTNSSAIFSHFHDVRKWHDHLDEQKISSADYPFNQDHSALHHLIDEGWVWVLRFNNGLTSAGIVFDHSKQNQPGAIATGKLWKQILEKYPSLKDTFQESWLAEQPGLLIRTGRLQRRLNKVTGNGWIALPNTAGFIDPMHSTGIAHTLSGVERILDSFEHYAENPLKLQHRFKEYESSIFNELDFIDLLVSGCHRSTKHFELFTLYSMLYFTATIAYEQSRLKGEFNIEYDQFLSANHAEIPVFTRRLYSDFLNILKRNTISDKDIRTFREAVRRHIEPYNIAGLLRPQDPNMYHHTIADF